MKKLIVIWGLLAIEFILMTNYTFAQSLLGTWDKVSGPGDPIRYTFLPDSKVLIQFQTSTDTATYLTFQIYSSSLRDIGLGQDGEGWWKGIFDVSSDSVLQIEGYWHTGLPLVPTPTSFTTPTTYIKVNPSIVKNETEIPMFFLLQQNYPNPFNPTTNIEYRISNIEFVSLKIYDVLGNEVATLVNEEKPAGTYTAEFNAARLSSGVYFYRLQAGNLLQIKKMVLMK